jgi:rhodanese-related sulfurtransferase
MVSRRVSLAIVFAAALLAQACGNGDAAIVQDTISVPPLLAAGSRIPLEHGWKNREQSIVLLVDVDCPGSNASTDFYRVLSERVSESGSRQLVIIAASEEVETRAWLHSHGISGTLVAGENVARLGFIGTPTLLAVDSDGIVTDVVLGPLSEGDEAALLARVDNPADTPPVVRFTPPAEVSNEEFERTVGTGHAQVVDIRERREFRRARRSGAVNIPDDELDTRAPAELSSETTVFLDCLRIPRDQCRIAGLSLREHGFRHVTLIVP